MKSVLWSKRSPVFFSRLIPRFQLQPHEQSVVCPWSICFVQCILGDPGVVNRDDRMFVAEVYYKIDLIVNFRHEHSIVPTNCPWVSEDVFSGTLIPSVNQEIKLLSRWTKSHFRLSIL